MKYEISGKCVNIFQIILFTDESINSLKISRGNKHNFPQKWTCRRREFGNCRIFIRRGVSLKPRNFIFTRVRIPQINVMLMMHRVGSYEKDFDVKFYSQFMEWHFESINFQRYRWSPTVNHTIIRTNVARRSIIQRNLPNWIVSNRISPKPLLQWANFDEVAATPGLLLWLNEN